ncbi:MAG: endonuclease domain-containing protein [Minisyncoccia bacterium]
MTYLVRREKVRKLRKESTNAEKMLWKILRNSTLGFKFRRQHPIENFIVDFYCFELKLAIELDGSVHNERFQKDYDNARTKSLNVLGINVLRFSNTEVENNIENVLDIIKSNIKNFL